MLKCQRLKKMKIKLTNKNSSLYSLLRKAGYFPCRDFKTKKKSFVRPLGGGHYPRFHIHHSPETNCLYVHLDQKPARYGKGNDHAAEYDSELVKSETERVELLLEEK